MMVRRLLVTLMICSLSAGPGLASDASSPGRRRIESGPRIVPRNVELDINGNLNFAFVNSIGQRQTAAAAIVVVDQTPKRYQANDKGQFVVPVRKSGVVVVVNEDFTYGCRVWKHGTAPPKSLSTIAFVQEKDAVAEVRGQALRAALRSTEKLYGLAILGLGGWALWKALDGDDDAS